MSDIIWPADYRPGFSDNFVSNEIVVPGLDIDRVWTTLIDTQTWTAQYDNATDIAFHDHTGPVLQSGSRFRFTTFGFPVEAEVVEFVPPIADEPARIAWHGWVVGGPEERLDVHHAWLFEALDEGRVRLLTQETQNGTPARALAGTKPNPMLNAHQNWIEGLARVAATR